MKFPTEKKLPTVFNFECIYRGLKIPALYSHMLVKIVFEIMHEVGKMEFSVTEYKPVLVKI